MKRSLFLVSTLVLIILIPSCKKNALVGSVSGNRLIDSSRSFFENEILPRSTTSVEDSPVNKNDDPGKWRTKTALWDNATVTSISTGAAVLVPIKYGTPYLLTNSFSGKKNYSSNDINQLLIYRDKDGVFHAEKLTFLPDSNFVNSKGQAFTGIINVETWDNIFLKRFKYEANGKIEKYNGPVAAEARTSNMGTTEMTIVTTCYSSSGYNYSPSDPDHGWYWSQNLGCQSYFIEDVNNSAFDHSATGPDYSSVGGGGSSGGASSTNTFSLFNGDKPVYNIIDYTKCFTNTAGSSNSYTVTLCVEQPQPGSRETWGFSGSGSSADNNPVSVGHTFLILNQTNSLGSTVRNVGFYPANGVTPLSPQSKGQINNDGSHDYDISVTITMDNSQFFQVVNYINLWTESGLTYDLNSNNCTTFALNALATAGVNLPRTSGSWLNGGGVNPGDLGEDIRTMALPSNMTRTTLTGTHQNVGVCN